jgi:uncharacterized protein (UPF0548 family)
VRLRRATGADLAALLEQARSDELTYAPTGGTLDGPTPPGLTRRHWSVPLPGTDPFPRAVEALREWRVHRGAGLALATDGFLAVGTNVAFSAPLPLGFVDGTCRIVAVVDEPDRFGFAYGTLSVHPERGEESFVVDRDTHDDVRFEVHGISRPSPPFARALSPIADRLQDRAVHRYLSAMQRCVSSP